MKDSIFIEDDIDKMTKCLSFHVLYGKDTSPCENSYKSYYVRNGKKNKKSKSLLASMATDFEMTAVRLETMATDFKITSAQIGNHGDGL
jgi:hypothetical protein